MAWTNLATRVANVDSNAAADVNALMADLLLIKGGTAGTAPTEALEALITRVNAIPASEYSTPTTNVTLTSASKRTQIINPNGSYNVTLPTTGIVAGDEFVIENPSYKVLTVKSSDTTTLKTVHHNGIGRFVALASTPTGTGDWSQRVEHPIKQYIGTIAGTAYTNGTITITHNISNPVIPRMVICPYLTDDGTWRAKISGVIGYTGSAADPVVTISGLTFKNVTDWYQEGIAALNNNGAGLYYQAGDARNMIFATPNTGDLKALNSTTTYSTNFYIDAELESKPTWAD
jgi:hypothetical protein